jgi:hypothetical protein
MVAVMDTDGVASTGNVAFGSVGAVANSVDSKSGVACTAGAALGTLVAITVGSAASLGNRVGRICVCEGVPICIG